MFRRQIIDVEQTQNFLCGQSEQFIKARANVSVTAAFPAAVFLERNEL